MKVNKLTVVICTSNAYSDFVNVFKHFFYKNFKTNMEVEFFVVGITEQIDIDGIKCLPSTLSKDAPWSNRIIEGLSQIVAENILFLTEDILFVENNKKISFDEIYQMFINDNLDYLRLSPLPPPSNRINNIYGEVSPFMIHRVSMQPSIWKYDFLMSIIKRDETIWEFEIKGSMRTRNSKKIMALNHYFIPYEEVISRGKITRKGFTLLKKNNFEISFEQQSLKEHFTRIFYKIVIDFFSKIFSKKYFGI